MGFIFRREKMPVRNRIRKLRVRQICRTDGNKRDWAEREERRRCWPSLSREKFPGWDLV